MSARTRKLRKVNLANVSFAAAKNWLTRRRLAAMAAVSCVLLIIAGVRHWNDTPTDNVDISADQLDKDFNTIGLGPLGVPESARISQVDGSSATGGDSDHHGWMGDTHNGDVEHAVVETAALDGQVGASRVMFPEAIGTDGPLFPDPLSALVGRIDGPVIQPTQFETRATPTPAVPSGPAWLTGGIEFADEQTR